ncbi:uncharacterized protein GIQ15_05404 [Arthroderma uncinatum]|uniref:uncharacterized protein n=1 Tax=Arthroderma uncinatum TaxID=74035 RepID=UPI00144AA54E|nr:uncharacterized protein GIQ15_05404 [Arthroderma uncinatum]KAF3480057.1 hypothetical protein GIQ15_05404 [Arthroderma uncinatum]
MGGPEFYQDWIGDLFDNLVIWCNDDKSEWLIQEKLSERATFCPGTVTGTRKPLAEGQAVYTCRQIEGKSVGMEAIVKIRLQVPPEYPASKIPAVRKRLASTEPSSWTNQEVGSLRHFNKKGCKVTPKLFNVKRSLQEWGHSPVPGGYIMFIVMEKVPGVPLTHFWEYDMAKRNKIRAAFRKSLDWFVDFEHIFVDEKKEPMKFSEGDYILWGLARSSARGTKW